MTEFPTIGIQVLKKQIVFFSHNFVDPIFRGASVIKLWALSGPEIARVLRSNPNAKELMNEWGSKQVKQVHTNRF